MKALAAKVDWNESLSNNPDLYVVVDDTPKREDLRFHAVDLRDNEGEKTAYVAELNGYCRHLVHAPGNEDGYGGDTFELTMADETKVAIKGPWSGRPSLLEIAEMQPAMGVTLRRLSEIDLEDVLERRTQILESLEKRNLFELHAFERRHHKSLRDLDEGRQPEDVQLAYDLVLHDRGLWFSATVTVEWAQEVVERLLPDVELYPYYWDRLEPAWWVPARKPSKIYDPGCPQPKQEGHWGYALHDEHGYPQSKFFDTIDDLVDDLAGSGIPFSVADNQEISARRDGEWIPLNVQENKELERNPMIVTSSTRVSFRSTS